MNIITETTIAQNQVRLLVLISVQNSCVKTRSGGKGRRLFKSVRKGFSLMLHKNSQSDATPPFRRITSAFIGTDTLDEIEEDTTYPGEYKLEGSENFWLATPMHGGLEFLLLRWAQSV